MKHGHGLPAASKRWCKRNHQSTAARLSVLFPLLLLAALASCSQHQDRQIPNHLLGVWRTDAPAYADRSLELTKETLTFETGSYRFDVYPVLDVDSTDAANHGISYTIHYLASEDFTDRLQFTYRAGRVPTIRFVHRNELWRVSDSRSWN